MKNLRRFLNNRKKFGRMPMIWDKPGGQGEGNSPWGRKRGNQGPPDLDQIFRNAWNKLRNGFAENARKNSSGSSGEFPFLWPLLAGVCLILYLTAGVYIVKPAERAVVVRLGQYVRTVGPGPHWLFPLIESKEIVNIEQVSTSEQSGLVLTKDGNIVSIGVAVQYRIGSHSNDVRAYLFNVVHPVRSLDESAASALRQVLGQFTMDEVLTDKRSAIAAAIKEQVIETLDQYNTGLLVLDVAMQFAKPPDEVRAAFDEVIQARADEERLVNQAKAYGNEVLPRAKGTAERLRDEALGYQQETILIAEGNVARFNLVLPQYNRAPNVMQTRMYLDTIEQILRKSSKIVLDVGTPNSLMYLPLEHLLSASNVDEKPKEKSQ